MGWGEERTNVELEGFAKERDAFLRKASQAGATQKAKA
jgi:hypothetical protein